MDSNGLGKLIPKAVKRRRKRASSEDLSVGPTTSQGTVDVDADTALGNNSVKMSETAGTSSSLVSYDSESDLSATRPQTISTHPSQVGYLTTSSPLVQAVYTPESQPPDDRPSTSSTFPSQRSDSVSSDSRTSRSQTSLLAPKQSSRRSSSPAGRIKGIFRSKKSNSNLSGSPSPERRSVREAESEADNTTTSITETPRSRLDPQPEESERPPPIPKNIDTTAPPRTPPSSDAAAPLIVNTPPTPTGPSFGNRSSPARQTVTDEGSPQVASNEPSLMHRRLRSGSGSAGPSKLSNITLAPLTPTAESGPVSPSSNPASGFFSSVISAAQNAANTLSNSIQNTSIGPGPNKPKAPFVKLPSTEEVDSVEVDPPAEALPDQVMEKKEPAVKTLGAGDLSLSQLGLADVPKAPTPVNSKFPEVSESRTRSESTPVDATSSFTSTDMHSEEVPAPNRPKSLNETAGPGEQTPPGGSFSEDKAALQRSGSIRSAIGRRRKRGSSATTGATGSAIGAAIAAANASVARPNANASAPKLTGFAIASKKRNRDFHSFFKSVPDDDYLIEDYSCALQREILAQGRLYVSEGHLCFSSNILGWVTTLVMSFDEIVSVEKRNTALIFKNGLLISTLQNKHIFASFTSRDATYDLIVNIWKIGHPSLRSTLNGDKTEKIVDGRPATAEAPGHSASGSEDDSDGDEDEDDDDDDVYDEDEGDDVPDITQPTELTAPDLEMDKTVTRKASNVVAAANGTAAEQPKDAPAPPPGGEDFPGPATHAPTDCGDATTHYDKIVGDDVIPAPLGKVYNLIFGPPSVTWMSRWLTGEQKCTDLQLDDKKGLSSENKTRTYNYIKPLNGSIGPKQTKCIVSETVDNIDFQKAVNISVITQNPDVPSGNVFSVKTKYCLSWAENNSTRIQVNCTVEWTGKSWLKGPIERGASDGQTQHCKDLFASLKSEVSARPKSGIGTNGAPLKGKKKGRKGRTTQSTADLTDSDGTAKHAAKRDWGLFEPVRGIAEPLVDIIKPILTGNVMYGLLVGLLVATWFGFGFTDRRAPQSYGPDLGFYGSPDRIAAYEEMWRREESELWDWLEERVGLDRLQDGAIHTRKRAIEPRTVGEKLREERMDDREIEDAIRVTEDKLKILKEAMGKKRGHDKLKVEL